MGPQVYIFTFPGSLGTNSSFFKDKLLYRYIPDSTSFLTDTAYKKQQPCIKTKAASRFHFTLEGYGAPSLLRPITKPTDPAYTGMTLSAGQLWEALGGSSLQTALTCPSSLCKGASLTLSQSKLFSFALYEKPALLSRIQNRGDRGKVFYSFFVLQAYFKQWAVYFPHQIKRKEVPDNEKDAFSYTCTFIGDKPSGLQQLQPEYLLRGRCCRRINSKPTHRHSGRSKCRTYIDGCP